MSVLEEPGPSDRSSVVAIVVNYRTAELTIQCVESLLRSAGVQLSIVVVDNASDDESVDRIRAMAADHPSVTVLARSANDGYAGGNNAGLALGRQMRARYAFIVNSDATVDPACLNLLIEEIERGDRVAIASPRIFFGAEPDRLWFGGGRFSLWTGRPVHVGYKGPAAHGWQTRRDLSFATGCALLVRLESIEGDAFDASLFSYAEDLDLSLRLRRAGYRIRYVPEATVWHFEGSSHRRAGGQSLRFYLSTRNLLRVLARHARWYHWVTLGPMVAIDVVGRYCAVAIRNADRAAFAAVLRGAWHAMVGGRHTIEAPAAVVRR